MSRKWLIINREVGYNRIINCTNVAQLTNIGKCWYRAEHKALTKLRKRDWQTEHTVIRNSLCVPDTRYCLLNHGQSDRIRTQYICTVQ